MKKLLIQPLLGIAVVVVCISCNNGSTTAESSTGDSIKRTSEAPVPPDNNKDTNKMKSDVSDFVMKAAIGGMMEVELGKLAQNNGGSQEVKAYGKMLETDHAEANSTLQTIATEEHITMPAAMDEEHSMHVKDMSAKKGAEFDKAFIPMMIEDHEKDITMFKKAGESNPDKEVKDFATKALPTLQKHLDKAKMLKDKMK